MKKLVLILLALSLQSCSLIEEMFEEAFQDKTYLVQKIEQDDLALVLSHNINGETHPCGCHQFPRGGMAQLAGLLHQLKEKRPVVYVDTGDAFFPSSVVPEKMIDSLTLTARTIAKGMEKLGLQYFVPGDQDFALGLGFLNEIANTHTYHFLISNLTNPETIKHKEWAKLVGGPHRFYLVGLVDPKTLPLEYTSLFLDVNAGLERTLKLLENDGYDPKNPFHRLIVLSHSGLDPDRALARSYPQINWILGSHSHSFTQVPQKEGDTTIVQVLSRNHYAGEVRLSLKQDRTGDQFFMHEVKESLDTVLKPNPISEFINAYKTQLTEMQKEEQKLLFDHDYSDTPINTASSCLDCHGDQAEKWVTTPHSLAYLTLVRANQPYDLSCIQCHSVGAQDKRGFMTTEEMVRVDPSAAEENLSKLEAADLRTNYWTAMREAFKDVGVVKDLKPSKIKQLKNQWGELDKRFGVTHNFANVQCLNCHSQHPEHPFNISKDTPPTELERQSAMQSRCMNCHNQSQSPAWYVKNEQGLPGDLDAAVFEQALKKVACPKSEAL